MTTDENITHVRQQVYAAITAICPPWYDRFLRGLYWAGRCISSRDHAVQAWWRDTVIKGQELLAAHRRHMEQSQFRWKTRAALRFYYERPAHQFFEKQQEWLTTT